jgi:hypothetical protein
MLLLIVLKIIATHIITCSKKIPQICFVVFLVYGYILLQQKQAINNVDFIVLISMLGFLTLLYFLVKLPLIITNEGITKPMFFNKQSTVLWKEVIKSELQWDFHGHGATLSWCIYAEKNPPMVIFPIFYSRKSLQLIADSLVEKCPGASIDPRLKLMAAGNFPWFIL